MLPIPVGANRSRTFRRSRSARQELRTFLLTRSRLTNLAFILLSCLAGVSLLLNLQLYLTSNKAITPHGILATISRPTAYEELDHLIMVPGHSIWKGTDPELRFSEDQWVLEHYQKGGKRLSALIKHIEIGAKLAAKDEKSLLVFSGGQTRPTSTTTEAESYLRLAQASNAFGVPASMYPFARATTEDYALDSYQNLLFSIARFHEYTGRYPVKITVVGYEMKRARFIELHRRAIRWPEDKFEYIGVDPEGEEKTNAAEGEKQNGYLPYTTDTYGCHSTLLAKRRQRNQFLRFHSYYTSAPELAPLLSWCPSLHSAGSGLYTGDLPWDSLAH
ncbi:hypothetical protein EV122DRAFT_260322 [Schizophyllum commune]